MRNLGIEEFCDLGIEEFRDLEIVNYKRFEELPCWQKSRKLSRLIYELTNNPKFNLDYSLKDQIRRAVGSIMDNIAEGFEDGSSREFVRFLGYSQRSCGEVQSQLYRALDNDCISQEKFGELYALTSECRKQIKGFRKYLREYHRKGQNSK